MLHMMKCRHAYPVYPLYAVPFIIRSCLLFTASLSDFQDIFLNGYVEFPGISHLIC